MWCLLRMRLREQHDCLQEIGMPFLLLGVRTFLILDGVDKCDCTPFLNREGEESWEDVDGLRLWDLHPTHLSFGSNILVGF